MRMCKGFFYQMVKVEEFVIGSFGVQNLFFCIWRLCRFVIRSTFEEFEETAERVKYRD